MTGNTDLRETEVQQPKIEVNVQLIEMRSLAYLLKDLNYFY